MMNLQEKLAALKSQQARIERQMREQQRSEDLSAAMAFSLLLKNSQRALEVTRSSAVIDGLNKRQRVLFESWLERKALVVQNDSSAENNFPSERTNAGSVLGSPKPTPGVDIGAQRQG